MTDRTVCAADSSTLTNPHCSCAFALCWCAIPRCLTVYLICVCVSLLTDEIMQQEIRPLLAVDIIEQLHRQFALLSGM